MYVAYHGVILIPSCFCDLLNDCSFFLTGSKDIARLPQENDFPRLFKKVKFEATVSFFRGM